MVFGFPLPVIYRKAAASIIMTAIAAPIIPDAFANIRSSTHICDVVKGFWIIWMIKEKILKKKRIL